MALCNLPQDRLVDLFLMSYKYPWTLDFSGLPSMGTSRSFHFCSLALWACRSRTKPCLPLWDTWHLRESCNSGWRSYRPSSERSSALLSVMDWDGCLDFKPWLALAMSRTFRRSISVKLKTGCDDGASMSW